jgi:hypothetical protein
LRQTFVEHYSAEVLSNLKGEQMDTTTATDLAKSVFAEIQELINKGQAEALTNSTSQNTSTSDSSSSGVPGTAENAWAQIQQSFTTAQAQALADLSGSEGNTSTDSSTATASTDSSTATASTDSSTATASTDSSTATTSTDSSTATTSTAATPSVDEQLTQVGQSQVTANLASDSLTNPGSDNSSTSSDAFNVQFVPGDSESGTIGQVSGSFADGQQAFSLTLGASGPVNSSGDGEGASGNTLSSITLEGDIANYVASLFGVTPTA